MPGTAARPERIRAAAGPPVSGPLRRHHPRAATALGGVRRRPRPRDRAAATVTARPTAPAGPTWRTGPEPV
ncbi:hypothetical protein DEF23_19135, partial [Marinitenerispora sediminis]